MNIQHSVDIYLKMNYTSKTLCELIDELVGLLAKGVPGKASVREEELEEQPHIKLSFVWSTEE